MKKKLLLLGVCLVLASSSVFAQCDCTKTEGSCTCRKISPMAPGPVINPPFAPKNLCTEPECPQAVMRYKRFITAVQRERATIYNALNLTDEQIQKREEIMKENDPIYEQKFDCLIKESFKLKALKSANASEREIYKQRQVVKDIKKDIEKLLDCENKTFQKSLTRLQRSKYKEIKKLECHDFKRAAHQKDYYKSNPQMRPFGNPCRCSCPVKKNDK